MKYFLLLAILFSSTGLSAYEHVGNGDVIRYMPTCEMISYRNATNIFINNAGVVRFTHLDKTFYIDTYYEVVAKKSPSKKAKKRRKTRSENGTLILVILALCAAAGAGLYYVKKKRDEEDDMEDDV